MKKILFYFLVLHWLIFPAVIYPLADYESPESLFAQATKLIKSAREAEKTSYAEAFRLYGEAWWKIERITTKFASKPMAKEILQCKLSIGPFTHDELKKVIIPLAKLKAEAEGNPLVCAYLVTRAMKNSYSKTALLSEIIAAFVKIGQEEQALQIAEEIKDHELKIKAQIEIAIQHAQSAEKDKSLELLSEAYQETKNMDAYQRVDALLKIATRYFEVEEKDKTFQLLTEAAEIAKNVTGAQRKSEVLAKVAAKYADVGKCELALQIVTGIKNGHYKTQALSDLTGCYAQSGQPEQALQIAKGIKNRQFKAKALIKIGTGVTQIGQETDDKTKKILHEIIRELPDSQRKIFRKSYLVWLVALLSFIWIIVRLKKKIISFIESTNVQTKQEEEVAYPKSVVEYWSLVVVVLYGLIFIVLTLPLIIAAFHPISHTLGVSDGLRGLAESLIKERLYWILIVVMMLSEAMLLIMPVRIASSRPVKRIPVFITMITVALMMGLLVAGVVLAISETISRDGLEPLGPWDGPTKLIALVAFIFIWIFWAIIFYRWSKKLTPRNFIERQCRYLFCGSALELLIAVPTHIVARSRDYCCAGYSTFLGIVFGLSVMLFSFGPGIFFLYLERWNRIRRNNK